MANTRVSDLATGGAFATTDFLYVVETAGVGGVNKTGTQLQEFIEDVANAALVDGSNLTKTYDDVAGTITFDLDSAISLDSVTTDAVFFNTGYTPLGTEGELYYDDTNKCLAFNNDEADSTLQIGQENWVRVRNVSGATISNGKAVYITGAEAGGEGRLTVGLAIATATNTARVVGLATHDIENNSYGYISQFGEIRDIDTSGFTAGDELFLSADTAGELTNTEPAEPNRQVFVGWCETSDAATGKVFITTIGNDSADALSGEASAVEVDARKGSAGTISAGQVVYIAGYNNGQNVLEVELARSDAASTMPAIGVAESTITNSQTGRVIIVGRVGGIDTSGLAVNDALYVSPTTAGLLTTTRPVGSDLVQAVARVVRVNASNGFIEVVGAGRANDIPNFTAADKYWYGGTGGVATEGDITSFGRSLVDDADAPAARDTLEVALVQKQGFLTPHEELTCERITATTCDIDADALVLFDTDDNAVRVTSVNLTVNITSSGANGLDTGSEASSTWYHLWVIYNGTTVAGLISTSSTAPTLPSGYTYKGYVGAVYNDSSSDFDEFKQEGNKVGNTYQAVGSSLASGTYASIDLSATVPPTAKAVTGESRVRSTTSAISRIFLAADTITPTTGISVAANINPGGTANDQSTSVRVALLVPQTVYYQTTGTNPLGTVLTSGYEF